MSDTTKRIRKRLPLIVIAVMLFALLAFFIARGIITRVTADTPSRSLSSGGRGARGGRRGSADGASQQFAVTITTAVEGDLSDFIRLNGDVVAQEEVDIFPDINGKVRRIDVDLGQSVGSGERLAVVDASRPGQSFVPSPVRSQIAGTVTKIYVDVGDAASVTQPLIQISDTRELLLESSVAERYVSKIAFGKEAVVNFEALPGEPQYGFISEVSPVIDTRTRTQKITISFSAQHPLLRPGMFGSIRLITQTKEGSVKIPADCVVHRFGTDYVFVVQESAVVQRPVAVGINVDNIVEIVRGVSAGERVVYKGQTLLEDGSEIRVVDEVAPLPSEDDLRLRTAAP